jgi:hypothetical protein
MLAADKVGKRELPRLARMTARAFAMPKAQASKTECSEPLVRVGLCLAQIELARARGFAFILWFGNRLL